MPHKPDFENEAEVLRKIAQVLSSYCGIQEIDPVYRGDHHIANPTSWRFRILDKEYTLEIFGE